MSFLKNYQSRVKITVDFTKVGSDLANFPIYVNLANLPSDFHTKVNQTDGRDIRVTTSDGITEVPREVVFYSSASDTGELHFKAKEGLSSTVNTVFYIYYGDANASDYAVGASNGRNNVWNNYKAVHHFGNGTTLSVTDSSGNNDATNSGGTATTGFNSINGGVNLDGSSYLTSALTAGTVGSVFTISVWGKKTDVTTVEVPIAFDQNVNDTGWILVNVTGTDWRWQKDEPSFPAIKSTTSRSNNTWYLYTITTTGASAGNTKLYTNGSNQDDGAAVPTPTSTYTLTIGNQRANTNPTNREWTGVLDEVRITSSALTSQWLSTEYNNQNSPSTFYTVGAAEFGSFLPLPNKLRPSIFAPGIAR